MSYQIKNNFSNLKSSFKSDTGLDSSKNPAEYIAYVNARANDIQSQIMAAILQELSIINNKRS